MPFLRFLLALVLCGCCLECVAQSVRATGSKVEWYASDRPTIVIEGQVKEGYGGDSLPGATVTVGASDGGSCGIHTAGSDLQGRFRIELNPVCRGVTLQAAFVGYGTTLVSLDLVPGDSAWAEVFLDLGGLAFCHYDLPITVWAEFAETPASGSPMAVIDGRAMTARGDVLVDAVLEFARNGRGVSIRSGEDGSFLFGLPPGRYMVKITPSASGPCPPLVRFTYLTLEAGTHYSGVISHGYHPPKPPKEAPLGDSILRRH